MPFVYMPLWSWAIISTWYGNHCPVIPISISIFDSWNIQASNWNWSCRLIIRHCSHNVRWTRPAGNTRFGKEMRCPSHCSVVMYMTKRSGTFITTLSGPESVNSPSHTCIHLLNFISQARIDSTYSGKQTSKPIPIISDFWPLYETYQKHPVRPGWRTYRYWF